MHPKTLYISEIGGKSIYKMNYFVSSRMLNIKL